MRKAFVVLEGIDGSGKSVLTREVSDQLAALGYQVRREAEPTDSAIGQLVRASLSAIPTVQPETLALLFAADRVEHCRRIARMFDAGVDVVVCDRYVYSSFAYQNVPEAWNHVLNAGAKRPDLAYLIDVPVDLASERIKHRTTSAGGETPNPDKLEMMRVASRYASMVSNQMLTRIDGARPFVDVVRDLVDRISTYVSAGG